jgi:hypothetical protein
MIAPVAGNRYNRRTMWLIPVLATLGMISIGVIVWRLLQKQGEQEDSSRNAGAGDENDRPSR